MARPRIALDSPMVRIPAMKLPTGTVTFLFTDIEGSTKLLVELGDRYEPLLAAHARLLRDAFRANGGVEVNTEGDAFFVVFPSATGALRAVTAAQRALASGSWPEGAAIRVRMGLHTGDGQLGGDDYAGLDVNRAARIASAAHGGQVVLSDPTRALVEKDLPTGVELRDLGSHRLKDLPDPEHLWQVDIEGLDTEFRVLRTLDARLTNLPTTSTTLVGRASELRSIRELIEQRRLVTLTGPGGTGKTRLAIAAAASLLDAYPDGVFLVALEDAHDRSAVASEIAAALGVRERPDRDPEAVVASFLRDRDVLLVLDNFEQVVVAAPIVSDLLAVSPRLHVIATSRESLRVSGEQELGVPPLGIPAAQDTELDALVSNGSVALFVERAREVRADFGLSDENAADIVAICRRLDGLPLAIELAAARIRLLSPAVILDRLDRALPLLAGGGRDRPERQQTLTAAIDWSYELLDDDERRLFACLAVFAGGWTLDAAERVCGPLAEAGLDLFEGLTSLVEKNLVRTDAETSGDPRFGMLGLIREYAADRLAASPDAVEVPRRHAAWVVALAEEAEPELMRADLRHWQGRIRSEEDNVRTALRWAIDRDEAEMSLRTAGSLWRFWHYWGEVREGIDWLERVLAMSGAEAPTEARAKALAGLGGLRYWQGQAEVAEAFYEEALTIRRRHGDERAIADALQDASWTALAKGEVVLARERSDEAIEHYRAAGDEAGEAKLMAWRRIVEFNMGAGGSYREAAAATLRAAEVNQRLGLAHDASEFLGSNAYVHWIAGHPEAAGEALRRALPVLDELGHIGRMGSILKMSAAVELALGRPARAVTLAAAAARHADELGGELGGGFLQVGDPLEESREQLAPEVHAEAIEKGRAMSLDEVIAYVLEEETT